MGSDFKAMQTTEKPKETTPNVEKKSDTNEKDVPMQDTSKETAKTEDQTHNDLENLD